jgi:TonB family protein
MPTKAGVEIHTTLCLELSLREVFRLSSEEESLVGFTGFAGFKGIKSISLEEHRFVTAAIVSALLHACVFLALMAHADLKAPADFFQVSPPVLHASLVLDPQASHMNTPDRGKDGKRGESAVLEAKNQALLKTSFLPGKKEMTENPSSPRTSSIKEKIAAKPLRTVILSDETNNIPPVNSSETPLSESKTTFIKNDDFPAFGGMDVTNGRDDLTKKTGNGLSSGSAVGLSYGHTSGLGRSEGSGSGVGSGEGEGTGAGGYGGGLHAGESAAIPRYRDNAPPLYPPSARRRGYEGLVVLIVEVMADGRPGEVRIGRSSGYRILDSAAQKAAARWRFEPGTRNGKPVRMLAEVPVRFVLNK